MSNVDTTSLRGLLSKWLAATVEDLPPTSSLIWVGERQGIQKCAMQLEKVIGKIEDDGKAAEVKRDKLFYEAIDAAFGTVAVNEMDPFNTSGDRPK